MTFGGFTTDALEFLADLPTRDPGAGRLYEADTLDELWPVARSYGPYPWVDEDMLRADDRPVGWWDGVRR